MGNPVKGEIAFEVEGQGYTLVFDFNTICSVEETFDASISEVGAKMNAGMRASDLRTLVTAGLQTRHPGITEAETGLIIGKLDAQKAAEYLALAMQAAFPDDDKGAAEGTENPPQNRRARRASKKS